MTNTKDFAIRIGDKLMGWKKENVSWTMENPAKIEEISGIDGEIRKQKWWERLIGRKPYHCWSQFKFTRTNGDVVITCKYYENI